MHTLVRDADDQTCAMDPVNEHKRVQKWRSCPRKIKNECFTNQTQTQKQNSTAIKKPKNLMLVPKQFPRLLIRCLSGRYRNIITPPDKSTAVFNPRFRRIGVRYDDNIKPTPIPKCAFTMCGGEKLYILDGPGDTCFQDLSKATYWGKLNKRRRGEYRNKTTDGGH